MKLKMMPGARLVWLLDHKPSTHNPYNAYIQKTKLKSLG